MKRTRIAWAIASKDLRIELRSRIVANQILPFAAVIMVLFAFALDSDSVLQRVAPGLVWMATLFSMIVLVQRSYAIETEDGAFDLLRLSGLDPIGVFWGKTLALVVQLLLLEILLVATAILLYNATVSGAWIGGIGFLGSGWVLLVTTLITATFGLAAVGTLYGGLAAGFSGRETLLPLLVLPVVSPVVIGATRAMESAFGTAGAVVSEGWSWTGLLLVFAVAFGVGGSLAYGPLIEE
jgi:heme exporter protein B